MTPHVRCIAEVGSNFDGSLEIAKQYIAAASEAGADVVKFQTLKKNKLVAPEVRIDGEWQANPVYQKFSNRELPDEWHYVLKQEADAHGSEFMSAPFYLEAVDLLEDVGVSEYKIASGDITFYPLLQAVGETGKPVILSTGASTLEEVDQAVRVLQQAGAGSITLLHCVSKYPPRWSEMNLQSLRLLRETFGLPVGISDHSPGDIVPLAAVALGAVVIEKHVTFDRSSSGPDHSYALTIAEFGQMVERVRILEEALGWGEKAPTADEMDRRHRFRRTPYDPVTLRPTEVASGLWLRPAMQKD